MINFAIRNIKVFFRDKASVFFSLLAVFIIIGLYALFLGDVWSSAYKIDNIRFLMDSWIIAGLLAVTSLTTTMGAFGIMVNDSEKKISKDFYSAPISRTTIAGGYILSSFVIGTILSLVTLVISEVYIVMNGGELLGLSALLKTFGLILLSTYAGMSMVLFIVSFIKSQNAFAAISTVAGTLVGFLTGIYIPIGSLPEYVQLIVKIFPMSHSALLLRNVVMEAPFNASFANIPAEHAAEFRQTMGMEFTIGGHTFSSLASILIIAFSGALFFILSILNLSKKRK